MSFFSRVRDATRYYNRKYLEILKWGFSSKEIYNYTYDLSEKNLNYLAHTIAVVTKKTHEEIWMYIQEILNDQEFADYVIQKIKLSPYKNYADFSCKPGRRMGWYVIARIIKPKIIVETGVDKGLGAVVLCSALLRNRQEGFFGSYYGTDNNLDAGYMLDTPYSEVGKILYGDSIESLKNFNESIDLFVNDSDHSADYEYQEYLTIKNKVSSYAVILGDNAHVTDMLAKFSTETARKFLFFKEVPKDHWYPGSGIGISYRL